MTNLQHICELGTLLETLSPIEKEVFFAQRRFSYFINKMRLKAVMLFSLVNHFSILKA